MTSVTVDKKGIYFYLIAICTARVGAGFIFLINTWVAITLTENPGSASLTLIATVLPGLLLSPFIGVWIDRNGSSDLPFKVELIRFLILFCYAILVFSNINGIIYCLLVGFLIAVCAEISSISWRSLLSKNIPGDEMLEINSWTSTIAQSGQLIGAAMSGLLLVYVSVASIIGITSLIFLISAVFCYCASLYFPTKNNNVSSSKEEVSISYFSDTKEGFNYLKSRPDILLCFLIMAALITIVFVINGTVAQFVSIELSLSSFQFGLIEAAFAIGFILGGMLLVWAIRFIRKDVIVPIGVVFLSSGLMLLSVSQSFLIATLSYFSIGVSFCIYNIFLSLSQELTETHMQARVTSISNFINSIVGLIAYCVCYVISQYDNYRFLYSCLAVLLLGICLFYRRLKLSDNRT